MSRVLDGYLMGRAAGGREGFSICLTYRHLDRIAVLDGYLIGAVSRGGPDPMEGLS